MTRVTELTLLLKRLQLHTLQLLPGPERPSYAGLWLRSWVVEVLGG